MAKPLFRTRFCDLLGIAYPVVSAGMGRAARPELAAAVSNAGGLGVMGCTGHSPEAMRADIRRCRSLTDKPFGVDLLFPASIRASEEERRLPDEPPAFLDDFRRELQLRLWLERKRELEEKGAKTHTEASVRAQLEVVLEERVPVFASGLGTPDWLVPELHAHGILALALVGNVRQARRVQAMGVDIIVAQGYDAGGHTGRVGTFSLVPQVVDAVSPTPVLAAGGVGDGRGLVAALALGAVGVWVGTRFLATKEAFELEVYKERIVAATEEDTERTACWTGRTQRTLKNRFTQSWEPAGVQPYPGAIQQLVVGDVEERARERERADLMRMPMGQIAGMITSIKSAREVLEEMIVEAERLLREGLPEGVLREPSGPSSALSR